MTLFLIAHKVRGEAAFDVAEQMDCPICRGEAIYGGERGETIEVCSECDNLGYWWVIPTSGHRAYPYWCDEINEDWIGRADDPPHDLPDHYPPRSEPARADRIAALLAGLPKPPSAPIKRR